MLLYYVCRAASGVGDRMERHTGSSRRGGRELGGPLAGSAGLPERRGEELTRGRHGVGCGGG